MEDAGGLSSVRTKKHKFKKHKPTAPGLDDGPGDSLLEGRPESDEEDNVQAVLNAEERLQAAAETTPSPAKAPKAAKEKGARGGGIALNKTACA